MINATGLMKFVSRKPIKEKPKEFSAGGYEVITKEGKEIHFDWETFYGNSRMLDDGRVEITVDHIDFDNDFTRSSSDRDSGIEEMKPKDLASLKLTEASYECYASEESYDMIWMDVTEFSITDTETGETYSFEGLEEYNKMRKQEEESYSEWIKEQTAQI